MEMESIITISISEDLPRRFDMNKTNSFKGQDSKLVYLIYKNYNTADIPI